MIFEANKLFLYSLIVILINVIDKNTAFVSKYHNYDELTTLLNEYATNFPSKTYLYSIGKSIENRNLWVLAIADTKPDTHILLRPEVKYIGNMHGNEVPSKENLLQLIDYMLNNQNTDSSVDYIMKNMRVHIMPSMNPDGYEKSTVGDCSGLTGRYNAANYDLNRNFPDLFETNNDPIQPETQAVINWLENNTFVLSANFHGGSIVANYPYDNYASSNDFNKENPTTDDDVFKYIAKNYSFNHPTMRNSPCMDSFKDGITNGAHWYPVSGGMQDYNYWKYGCMEITLEISCCKFPSVSNLQTLWLENKKSMLEYLKLANTGVRGIVKFSDGQPAENVTVKIDSREPYFKSNKNGEFYRVILPGQYTLILMFNCKNVYNTSIVIPNETSLLVLNITLPNDLYSDYLNSNLNKYAQFCSSGTFKANATSLFINYSSKSFNFFKANSYKIKIAVLIIFTIILNYF